MLLPRHFCARFAGIVLPLQDKYVHRRLEAVGMLCNILLSFAFPPKKLFRRSITVFLFGLYISCLLTFLPPSHFCVLPSQYHIVP